MNTVSPGFDEALAPRVRFNLAWPRLAPAWWGGIAFTLVVAAAAAWRLAICFTSVLACTR